MENARIIESKDNIKVVTDNSLITAEGLSKLSLKARKLLYLIMAQCRQTDKEFYLYEITPGELALRLGIGRNHVYEVADALTDELLTGKITVRKKGEKRFKKHSLFTTCEYDDDSMLRVKLNPDMTEFLLGLRKSFTQTILSDYMKMRSQYSMAIWHLMQREMKGRKPGTDRRTFFLSLDELRMVTGTQNKLKGISQFKERVLDKAIREIRDCCGVEVTYTNHKKGRHVDGFYFMASGLFDLTDYSPSPEVMEKIRKIDLEKKAREEILTPQEDAELQELETKFSQMSLFDYDPEK